MDNNFLTILFFFLLSILHHPISASNLHKFKQLNSDFLSQSTSSHHTHTQVTQPSPTKYFEVTKPIQLPKTKPCSYHVLHHDFGYTYGSPPVIANYTSPSHCSSNKFSKIVLEWKATCVGRQFDRIFGVWLSGVELLRSCTAEPRTNGIVWVVEKDITRYQSLLLNHEKNQTFAVFLGNIVDKTYTGVYHVDVTIHFYPFVVNTHETKKINSLAFGNGFHADLILPISRNLPLNDGLWFEIQNSTDVGLKEFAVPRNAYRAVLEVYVSFHESDEFWYTNPPNEYLAANNLTDNSPGNGPFREVVVTLDKKVVGSVWPFTVIYTGGVNPLLWRPITGIGSFDLPSYDIEITPFLGTILDGKSHSFGFSVTNALNVWYIDANLHLWLDADSSRTEGELVNHIDKPLVESLVSDFIGLNGTFLTSAKKSILSTGWVRSSFGNITTSFSQKFDYYNKMVMAKDGGKQTVNQVIFFNDSVRAKLPLSYLDLVDNTHRRFSLYLDTDELEQNNDTYLAVSNATLGFGVNKSRSKGSGFSNSFLNNVQDGQGTMVVKKNLVISGVGETQQDYRYKSDESCYFRKIGVSNYTILYDKVKNSCNKRSRSRFGLNYIRKLPIML